MPEVRSWIVRSHGVIYGECTWRQVVSTRGEAKRIISERENIPDYYLHVVLATYKTQGALEYRLFRRAL